MKFRFLTSTSFLCFALLVIVPESRAEVKMPLIFGDHMVLQGGSALPVWGWAAPGEKISVTLGSQSAQAVAGDDGAWRVNLPPLPQGTPPQILQVAGEKNKLQFQDVLVGDVWLCSGQSNMQFGLLNDQNGAAEAAKADQPQIRLFCVPMKAHLAPQSDLALPSNPASLEARWQVCTPDTIAKDGSWGGFSALAYYFGREIHQVTGHPVGLIGSYWGGTPCQAWTSLEGLKKDPGLAHSVEHFQKIQADFALTNGKYRDLMDQFKAEQTQWELEVGAPHKAAMQQWNQQVEQAKAAGQPVPPKPPKPTRQQPWHPEWDPVVLYNGMIAPLVPYAIKGVIWYQGEANAISHSGTEYATLFPALISDWREKWGQGDFPFLYVQLANYLPPAKTPSEGTWPWIRDGQFKALALPNTGMASAIDIGNPNDIHPKDKTDVGSRLARVARQVAYGESLVASGPLYDSMKFEGSQIRISFKSTGGGLVIGAPPWTPDGKPVPVAGQLKGFAIAGADQNWVWAKAVIDGQAILVSSDQVPVPIAVRYGWADDPPCNLYNKEALPASPFRTDNWSK